MKRWPVGTQIDALFTKGQLKVRLKGRIASYKAGYVFVKTKLGLRRFSVKVFNQRLS